MTEHSTLAQLREAAAFFQQPPPPKATPPEVPIDTLLTAAADEIDRLRAALTEIFELRTCSADLVDAWKIAGSALEQSAREEGK